MISARRPSDSSWRGTAAALVLLLCGCVGAPHLGGTGGPLVITEAGPAAPASDAALTRAQVVRQQRAEARAAAEAPDVSTATLLARPEPRSAAEVAAIEAELDLIARRQAQSADRREMAALEARARELQRLVAAAEAGPLQP